MYLVAVESLLVGFDLEGVAGYPKYSLLVQPCVGLSMMHHDR
jgi:hypothetical protein